MKAFWMTFLISMLPVLELRGGIPYGVAHGLTYYEAALAACLGNMFPVPFIIVLIRKIFTWLKTFPKLKQLIEKLEQRLNELVKEQGRITNELKDLKKIKSNLMSEIVDNIDGVDNRDEDQDVDKKLNDNKRLINDVNEKLDNNEEELKDLH